MNIEINMLKKLATYICMLLIGGLGFLVNINSRDTINIGGNIVYAEFIPCWNGVRSNADGICPAAVDNADMQKMLQGLVNGLNIILDILTIIVTPAMVLASWLMSPDWTSGDIFQIRPMIHDLWVTVANITYFIYAVLLIFIALATIFNSDKYGYRQLLPKLALGILLVPLSWWFIQFVISLSTVVTASVISIPMEVVINYTKDNKSSWWTRPSIPEETKYSNGETDKDIDKKPCAPFWPPSPNQKKCISPEQFIGKAWGMYSNLMLYSFAVFRFQDVKILNSSGVYDKIYRTDHTPRTHRSSDVHRIWSPRSGSRIHAHDAGYQAMVLCDILTTHDAEVRHRWWSIRKGVKWELRSEGVHRSRICPSTRRTCTLFRSRDRICHDDPSEEYF